MNESEQNAVDGVRVLWPYMTPAEREIWIARMTRYFKGNFVKTVEVLSGETIQKRPSADIREMSSW